MEDTTYEIYGAVGGEKPFFDLVDAFYRGVETNAVLRPMYPDELTGAKQHLALFLIQRFGGPTTYSDQRGHPRLRMRHAPFVIGEAERDAWLKLMMAAVEETPDFHPFREQLTRYFSDSADFLINKP